MDTHRESRWPTLSLYSIHYRVDSGGDHGLEICVNYGIATRFAGTVVLYEMVFYATHDREQ